MSCHRFDPTPLDGMTVYYGHYMFDQIQQKTWVLEEEKSVMSKAMDVGFCGRVLDDHIVFKKAMERFESPPFWDKFRIMSYSFKGMIYGWLTLRLIADKCNKLKPPSLGLLTIEDVLESLEKSLEGSEDILNAHLRVTFASNLFNMFTFNVLSGGKDLTQDNYTDFANLIGSGNGALSGEVPFLLKDMARAIVQEPDAKDFCTMSPEDALNWLKNNTSAPGKKFRDFMERHGHRGMQEFDAYSISWGMNPTMLAKVLQDTSRYPAALANNAVKSTDLIATMKSPVTGIRKRLLPLFLRGSKMAICHREQSKSWTIKYFDCTRRSLRHLADLMVKEGYLPDPDLLFFMTYEEIITLHQTRSANLLRLAKQRHRIYPKLNRMKFPEMIDGFPVPIDENEKIVIDNMNQVTGFPVSKGIIKGPAKVVLSLDYVHTIEPGDILIASATDIGWSPYFPMLAGVVTEIGGLISHGAVVAREFGLPCIVGARHATKIFKSGDIVLLDATTGVIAKVVQ